MTPSEATPDPSAPVRAAAPGPEPQAPDARRPDGRDEVYSADYLATCSRAIASVLTALCFGCVALALAAQQQPTALGPWRTGLVSGGVAATVFFPGVTFLVFCAGLHGRFTRSSFCALAGSAAIGIPIGVLCWGGLGILPWGLAFYGATLAVALEPLIWSRQAAWTLWICGWAGEEPTRVDVRLKTVLQACITTAVSNLPVLLFIRAHSLLDMPAWPETLRGLWPGEEGGAYVSCALWLALCLCTYFGMYFKPGQYLRATAWCLVAVLALFGGAYLATPDAPDLKDNFLLALAFTAHLFFGLLRLHKKQTVAA